MLGIETKANIISDFVTDEDVEVVIVQNKNGMLRASRYFVGMTSSTVFVAMIKVLNRKVV